MDSTIAPVNSPLSPSDYPSLPPGAGPLPPPWGLASVCAAAGVVLASLAGGVLAGQTGVLGRLWINGLALPVGGTGAALLVLGWGRWRELVVRLGFPLRRGDSVRATLAGIYGGVGAFSVALPLVLASVWVLRWFGLKPPPPNWLVMLLRDHPRLDVWISVSVLVLVVAPVAEEILFRVVLVEAFQAAELPAAAALSALVFGVIHRRPDQLLGLCVLALWLYRLRVRYDSLRPAILAHAVFNVLALAGVLRQLTQT